LLEIGIKADILGSSLLNGKYRMWAGSAESQNGTNRTIQQNCAGINCFKMMLQNDDT
jgi:hypothetical protein